MTDRNEAEKALIDIEARLSGGRSTDVMDLAEEIMQVQQNLSDRLDKLEAGM
jgi:hypothetical protein